MDEIIKRLYGIRDYIVRGSNWINPAWYTEGMDDIDFMFEWLENIKDLDAGEEQ